MSGNKSPIEIIAHSRTPFFLLSLNYGIFYDDELRRTFTSLDAYLAWHMLVQEEDRQRVFHAHNGFIADRNLTDIVQRASQAGTQPISEDWDDRRESVLSRGVWLKLTQCEAIRRILLGTKDRPILDKSRREDFILCTGEDGRGQNLHGKILETVRKRLRSEA